MAEQKKMMYYINDNLARNLEPVRREEVSVPVRMPEEKKQPSREALRNQEKALNMSAPLVVFFALATVAVLFICIGYLQLQASITTRLYNIEQQEAVLAELKETNRNTEAKIDLYMDLDYVYQVATEELGMVYPSKDQVIHYDRVESEYVHQNENIPE